MDAARTPAASGRAALATTLLGFTSFRAPELPASGPRASGFRTGRISEGTNHVTQDLESQPQFRTASTGLRGDDTTPGQGLERQEAVETDTVV